MRFWLTNRRQSLSTTFHKYANETTPTPIPSKEGNRTVSVSPPTEGWPQPLSCAGADGVGPSRIRERTYETGREVVVMEHLSATTEIGIV